MRDQYAGDVSDYLKFAFLRAISGTEYSLGIAWYHVPTHDGGPDGLHLEWRDDAELMRLDSDLHALLARLPARSISALERLPIWPRRVRFHRAPIQPGFARRMWASGTRQELRDCDIIFLDPDNGLGRPTQKHATLDEVRAFVDLGKMVVLIKFPGRKTHSEQLDDLHSLLLERGGARHVLTIRTSISVPNKNGSFQPRARWFSVINATEAVRNRARSFQTALAALQRCRANFEDSSVNLSDRLPDQPTSSTRDSLNLAPSKGTNQRIDIEPRASLLTTATGFVNRNRQENHGPTGEAGNDYGQRLYRMRCQNCGMIYKANGSDIFQRKCPRCQGGRPSSET